MFNVIIKILTQAPSGAPMSFSLTPVNSTANNLTWNEVNCSQHNGLITGYTVMISNSSITYNLNSTERYIILNDLVFGTVYNISVAAVNSVGRGPFSDPIVIEIGIGMLKLNDNFNVFDIVQYLVQLVQYPVSWILQGLLSHGVYLVIFPLIIPLLIMS